VTLLQAAVARGEIGPLDTVFAAEQFMTMLLAGPQRRSLGLGVALTEEQTIVWRDQVIRLFLGGITA